MNVINSLTEQCKSWPTDSLIDVPIWLNDRLTDWPSKWLANWLVSQPIKWPTSRLANWLVIRLDKSLIHCLTSKICLKFNLLIPSLKQCNDLDWLGKRSQNWKSFLERTAKSRHRNKRSVLAEWNWPRQRRQKSLLGRCRLWQSGIGRLQW